MFEVIFLWVLALVFIIFAVVQDIRTREIANWINFSLIAFALAFRLLYSVFSGDDFVFFFNGLIGFGIFLVLGNVFYYARVFAGGDSKLLIALGAILPIYPDFLSNLRVFSDFFLLFLVVGFVYIISSSIFLCIKHFKEFKKEFPRQLKATKRILFVFSTIGFVFLILGFFDSLLFFFGGFIFFTAFLYVYSKAIEESSMKKRIKSINLREGDWLYSNLKVKGKMIKSSWYGVTKQEIALIRKHHKLVMIKEGIPFSPVFFFTFIIFIIFNKFGIDLWNSFG